MSKITNKELVQSYVVTTAKYDFSIDEKRILYRIIEILQNKTLGLKLKYDYAIEKDLFGDSIFTMPIRIFLKDSSSKHYETVKKALISLNEKKFEYEDSEHWGLYRIIESPIIKKYDSVVKIRITPLLLGAFLNFAKGYRKYELETAMSFKSIYTMRFYELLSGQSKPITFTIEKLKQMFKLENKYKRTNHFIDKVIKVAQEELKEESPYWFNFQINKVGRKYHSITFKPIYDPNKRAHTLEQKALQQNLSLRWELPLSAIKYLKENFDFTEQEIRNNIEIFKGYNITRDLMNKLAYLRKYCESKKNPKGYVIGALKKELEEIENSL